MERKAKPATRKKDCILYLHGLCGNETEAREFSYLEEAYDLIGIPYEDEDPWVTRDIIRAKVIEAQRGYRSASLIATSIGAFYATRYLFDLGFEKALFLSPLLDMKSMIESLMERFGIPLSELKEKGAILLENGQTLSSDFLDEVSRDCPKWTAKTAIVRGESDDVVPLSTIEDFALTTSSVLYVCPRAGHYLHTAEERSFVRCVAESFFSPLGQDPRL